MQLTDRSGSIQSDLLEIMPELAGAIGAPDETQLLVNEDDQELVQLETQSKSSMQDKLFNDLNSALNGESDLMSFLKQNKQEA